MRNSKKLSFPTDKRVEHSRKDIVFTSWGSLLSASITSWSPMIYGAVVLRVDNPFLYRLPASLEPNWAVDTILQHIRTNKCPWNTTDDLFLPRC